MRVDEFNPLATWVPEGDPIANLGLPPVAGRTVTCVVRVPGIGTGAAYADGDAFGTLIEFPNLFRPSKLSGLVMGAFLIDLDDEGLQIDVPLFIRSFTATADNSAFAPTDADAVNCRGVLQINTFSNWNANQFGQSVNVPWPVNAVSTSLFTQLVARGAPNIAAGSEPYVGLITLPD